MLLGTLLGVPIGILILQHITTSYIQLMLGLFLIFYGIYAFGKITFFNNRYNIILKTNICTTITRMISGVIGSLYKTHRVPVVISGIFTSRHITDLICSVLSYSLIIDFFVTIV